MLPIKKEYNLEFLGNKLKHCTITRPGFIILCCTIHTWTEILKHNSEIIMTEQYKKEKIIDKVRTNTFIKFRSVSNTTLQNIAACVHHHSLISSNIFLKLTLLYHKLYHFPHHHLLHNYSQIWPRVHSPYHIKWTTSLYDVIFSVDN